MRCHRSPLVASCLSVLLCCWTGVNAWTTRAIGNNHTYNLMNVRIRDGGEEINSSSSGSDLPGEGSVCAYRVLDKGIDTRVCFRHTLVNFTCPGSTCRQVRSLGGHLVANMLSNSTVLLQWNFPMGHNKPQDILIIPTVAPIGSPPAPVKGASIMLREPQGGFRMRCWWNGSYTQFKCASVQLASGCRDYLLSELHENVPYRICLQPAVWDGLGECVEFSVSPTGMQDIVIGMMVVGGAICVMLVIICLLVAYITENIMSPSVQHTLGTRQLSRCSHNTYL